MVGMDVVVSYVGFIVDKVDVSYAISFVIVLIELNAFLLIVKDGIKEP
jgi:hypothetical protein